jgi:hypothetical protein
MRVRRVVFAVVLAGSFILGTHYVAAGRQLEVFALFLALTSCVYGGAALTPAGVKHGAVELPFVILVFACSVMGLLVSALWVAVGYVAHGALDLLHHYRKIQTPVIDAFPPICAIFDGAVGLFVLWRWAQFG